MTMNDCCATAIKKFAKSYYKKINETPLTLKEPHQAWGFFVYRHLGLVAHTL